MRSTEVERLSVYCDETPAGTLERTTHGCTFRYDRSFLDLPRKPPMGIAFHLPYQEAPFELVGDNLPPFFANLLPEGLRLAALVARAHTSESDMFSLLVEAGPECIGDVYAVPDGEAPIRSPLIGQPLAELDFDSLMNQV